MTRIYVELHIHPMKEQDHTISFSESLPEIGTDCCTIAGDRMSFTPVHAVRRLIVLCLL